MKKFFRVSCGCILMAALCAGFMGCARKNTGSAGGKPKVAIVLKTLSSPFWQSALKGAREAAAKYDFELIELGPPTEDAVTDQINMMEDVLSKGDVVGIVFAPSQPPAAVNVLNRAKQANIPVAVIDTPMPDGYTGYLTFIGSNNYQIGILGAKEMLKVLTPDAKITILEGAPGNPSMTERADGAEKVFRDAGIVIQSRQPAYSDRNQALNIIQNVLQSDPDIAGVFSANDDQAEGAYRALAQNGKKGVVMGVDGNQSAKESVRDGGLFGTVAQDIFAMGFIGVESIYKAINGQAVEKKIDAPTPVITKDNVDQYL
ncbi:MAG: sugar ABC transporter substrate-binding protein [Treponema sp.]|jgi:ribose transport system substrate-binding protein|nr:sugar ABC transporter substrate-binding protein [Treponema sp.]